MKRALILTGAVVFGMVVHAFAIEVSGPFVHVPKWSSLPEEAKVAYIAGAADMLTALVRDMDEAIGGINAKVTDEAVSTMPKGLGEQQQLAVSTALGTAAGRSMGLLAGRYFTAARCIPPGQTLGNVFTVLNTRIAAGSVKDSPADVMLSTLMACPWHK